MRHRLLHLAGFFLCIPSAALCGLVLMTMVYLIPTDRILENVARSAAVFEEEGTYPVLVPWATSQLDNYTDAIMLMESAYQGVESPIEKGMMAYRYTMDGCNPVEALVGLYGDCGVSPDIVSYPRYWHGYMIFLKPLLLIMDYTAIRRLNGILQMLVTGLALLLMFRKRLGRLSLPYLLSVLFLMPMATAQSLQFSSCFYIFSAGVVLQLCNDDPSRDVFMFLFLGIATAFFDFLTYPIATFGIPAVVHVARHSKDNVRENVIRLVKMLFCWGIGYVGMWASKWILASILTGENVMLSALGQFFYRSSHYSPSGEILTARNAFRVNYRMFIHTPVKIVSAIFIVILAVGLMHQVTKNHPKVVGLTKVAAPYICLCLLPFVWYFCTVNHSTVHPFFTNKALSVTAFSGLCMLVHLYTVAAHSEKDIDKPESVIFQDVG